VLEDVFYDKLERLSVQAGKRDQILAVHVQRTCKTHDTVIRSYYQRIRISQIQHVHHGREREGEREREREPGGEEGEKNLASERDSVVEPEQASERASERACTRERE